MAVSCLSATEEPPLPLFTKFVCNFESLPGFVFFPAAGRFPPSFEVISHLSKRSGNAPGHGAKVAQPHPLFRLVRTTTASLIATSVISIAAKRPEPLSGWPIGRRRNPLPRRSAVPCALLHLSRNT